jgi:hypothetical protein
MPSAVYCEGDSGRIVGTPGIQNVKAVEFAPRGCGKSLEGGKKSVA